MTYHLLFVAAFKPLVVCLHLVFMWWGVLEATVGIHDNGTSVVQSEIKMACGKRIWYSLVLLVPLVSHHHVVLVWCQISVVCIVLKCINLKLIKSRAYTPLINYLLKRNSSCSLCYTSMPIYRQLMSECIECAISLQTFQWQLFSCNKL